jgi:hypothetical protein
MEGRSGGEGEKGIIYFIIFVFPPSLPLPLGLDAFAIVLHNGDLSYACGEGWIHEEFGSLIEPLASVLPYHVTLGNHEWDHGSAGIPGWNKTMAWCKSWGCKGRQIAVG